MTIGMMNLWAQLQHSKNRYVLVGIAIVIVLLICGIKYDMTRMEKNELIKKKEISRIED